MNLWYIKCFNSWGFSLYYVVFLGWHYTDNFFFTLQQTQRVHRYVAIPVNDALKAVRRAHGAFLAARAEAPTSGHCAVQTRSHTRLGAACSALLATPAGCWTPYTPGRVKVKELYLVYSWFDFFYYWAHFICNVMCTYYYGCASKG